MELSTLSKYFTKPLSVLGEITFKPIAVIACTPVLVMPVMTTGQKAIIALGLFFIIDFVTGIIASWVEFKKTLPIVPGSGKRYVLSSAKMRLSVVKFITYGLAIIIAYAIEWAFIIGEFEPHSKLQKMTLTTFVIAFCCMIEIYSILFENVKRMGFDIIEKIRTISKEGWKLYKTIKNDNNESGIS